jgi:hypothetical protein
MSTGWPFASNCSDEFVPLVMSWNAAGDVFVSFPI